MTDESLKNEQDEQELKRALDIIQHALENNEEEKLKQIELNSKEQDVLRLIGTRVTKTTYIGPLPSSSQLEELERLRPGFAAKFLDETLEQFSRSHQVRMAPFILAKRGQLFSLIITLTVILSGLFIAIFYDGKFGTIIASIGAFVTLVGAIGKQFQQRGK